MLIGEVAAATGVSTKTLRFHERRGLLPTPSRLSNGYRDYDRTAVARVAFVRPAQHAGFTLAQIREILAIRDGGQAPCVHVDALIHQRLEQTERRIAELHATRATLQQLAQRSDQLDASDCDGYCHIIQDAAAPRHEC